MLTERFTAREQYRLVAGARGSMRRLATFRPSSAAS